MFNTIDKMTNIHVDRPNRMFNTHAYVSSNLIFETTVHQEKKRGVTKKIISRKQKSKMLSN